MDIESIINEWHQIHHENASLVNSFNSLLKSGKVASSDKSIIEESMKKLIQINTKIDELEDNLKQHVGK